MRARLRIIQPERERCLAMTAGFRGRWIRVKNRRRLELQLVFSVQISVFDEAAPLMAEEARAVGIDLMIRQYDRRVLWSLDGPLYQARFQTALLNLQNGLDPDPSAFLSCDQRPPIGYNFARYCSAAVDRALQRAASVYDRAERRRIYSFIQRRMIAGRPLRLLVAGQRDRRRPRRATWL